MEEVYNPMYTPSAKHRKARGDKYPDAHTAFTAMSKRIDGIKAKSKALKNKQK